MAFCVGRFTCADKRAFEHYQKTIMYKKFNKNYEIGWKTEGNIHYVFFYFFRGEDADKTIPKYKKLEDLPNIDYFWYLQKEKTYKSTIVRADDLLDPKIADMLKKEVITLPTYGCIACVINKLKCMDGTQMHRCLHPFLDLYKFKEEDIPSIDKISGVDLRLWRKLINMIDNIKPFTSTATNFYGLHSMIYKIIEYKVKQNEDMYLRSIKQKDDMYLKLVLEYTTLLPSELCDIIVQKVQK